VSKEIDRRITTSKVAEGVEREETAQWLRKFGCDVVQGNYFCVPLPAGEIPYIPSCPLREISS
jgi:EAL domain-containing protein (putative c-di-GMP-specific phosphodiesterase class I)